MALTARESFKVAFVNQCLQQGMTLEEIHETIKAGHVKMAAITDLITAPIKGISQAAGSTAGTLGQLGLLGALAAPPIIGGTLGYTAARATDIDEHDTKAQKQRELIAELRRLTQQAQTNRLAKQYKNQREETGNMFV
jgi:fructose/tagatose bisphosphate aldolase